MTYINQTEYMPDGKLVKHILVKALQKGMPGDITPGDLAREMELITEEHLSLYGINREYLQSEGKTWVIVWTDIKIHRMPGAGEEIKLKIWPGKMKSVMYTRQYSFVSLDNEALVSASSLFLLMDITTRMACKPSDRFKEIPVVTTHDDNPLPDLTCPFPRALEKKLQRIVQSDEIDKNGHLNNTHYLDWAADLQRAAGLWSHRPEHVWVQYKKELLESQNVDLMYGLAENTLYLCGICQAEEAFLLKIKYKE